MYGNSLFLQYVNCFIERIAADEPNCNKQLDLEALCVSGAEWEHINNIIKILLVCIYSHCIHFIFNHLVCQQCPARVFI